MLQITSLNNKQIKQWKKLKTRKERNKQQAYLIEGYHLVEEALNYKEEDILNVIVREDIWLQDETQQLNLPKDKLVLVTAVIAKEISQTETNPGIFAEMKISQTPYPTQMTKPFLLLDRVQDPGNVGTMIRTADAADFQGVVLGEGTVDLYNLKTLRGAQGSHFHLEIYEGELLDFIQKFKENSYQILGTALNEQAKSYKEIELTKPFALVMGNEGAGVSSEIIDALDENIFIPMQGHAESLNVAIAASILMFHLN